jgi:23S rRNA (uracil1939-C5)-methyltransferase
MVKKDEILELEITSMTHEGMGVGKTDGFAVFVQGAIEGERVRAKIIKVLKSYAVARIEEDVAVLALEQRTDSIARRVVVPAVGAKEPDPREQHRLR